MADHASSSRSAPGADVEHDGAPQGDQPAVRTTRRYESPLRAAAARATHDRIVVAAGRCFQEHGWRGTTMADIARAADVSTQRVNLAGTKGELLLLAYARTIAEVAGAGSTDAPEGGTAPPDPMSPRAELPEVTAIATLPFDEALAAWAGFVARVHEAAAGLWFALRAAADTDEAPAAQVRAEQDRTIADCRLAVAWAAENGRVTAPGAAWAEKVDTWFLISSAETWRHYVVERGWSSERYRAWLVQALEALVFDPR